MSRSRFIGRRDSATTARRSRRLAASLAALVAGTLLITISTAGSADAATAVALGTAGAYSVLGGSTVTNTGPSRLSDDLGVSPGSAITGFPPGLASGATHKADAPALQAQSDLVIGYDDAAGQAPSASVAGDLVGRTLTAGVYHSSGPLALSGTLTLDAQGNQNSVFIFQVASTLITASASYVNLINGAQACNVFWQVGSSATLGTASVFRGTIMALQSISVTTRTFVEGRALARNGAVTLDNNVFVSPQCGNTVAATPSTTTVTATPKSTTSGSTTTVTATVTGATSPTGSVVFRRGGTVVATVPLDQTGHASAKVPVGTAAGTRTITATYGGGRTLLPSTSPPVTVTVRAAPKAPTPSVISPSVEAPPASTTPPLATTGTSHLGALAPAGAALIALGLALTWTGRARRRAHHRR